MFKKFIVLLFSFSLVYGEEIDLTTYEQPLYSFRGEDGLIARLFQLIQPSSRFVVEFSDADKTRTKWNYKCCALRFSIG